MKINEKYGRLNLQATINEDTIVVIEMQNRDNGPMDKRVVYYAETMIVDSKYKKYIIIDGIKICFVELPKFLKYCYLFRKMCGIMNCITSRRREKC